MDPLFSPRACVQNSGTSSAVVTPRHLIPQSMDNLIEVVLYKIDDERARQQEFF